MIDKARLVERWKYLVLPKAGPDGEGHARPRCPASNPLPVARCDADEAAGLAVAGPAPSASGFPNSRHRAVRPPAVPSRTCRPPPERDDRTTAAVTSQASPSPANVLG